MTPAEAQELHPEIFAIARKLRDQAEIDARKFYPPEQAAAMAAKSVRLRCIHDQDGELILGKRPDDMAAPGPVPDYEAEPEPQAPYRGKAR